MEEKKYPILPADDAVQNWFEANIDKECSASSAIYKFRLWLESLQRKAITGAVWVRATKLKIEYGKNYYAQWLDGNIKATGHFQESDGTFFWNVPGYIPIGKDEYEHLLILDEGTAAGREEDAVAFVHFCESKYSYVGDGKWDGEGDEMWTSEQLYELFKQQKGK